MRESGDSTISVVLADKKVIKQDIASLIPPKAPPPLRLFLSYAHKDEKYVRRLQVELKLMERNGLILPWYDRRLTGGEKWEPRILQELNEADAVICQPSPEYLASDFCLSELNAAIKRREAGEAELIPYVLRTSGWKEVLTLGEIQLLPADAKPLAQWKDNDQYWRAVAEGIQASLKKLQGVPSKPGLGLLGSEERRRLLEKHDPRRFGTALGR
jgi:hypothetical protein